MSKKKSESVIPLQKETPKSKKEQGSEITSYEIRKADALAPVENFDPKKNLRSVTSGVWRYICQDINAVKDEYFETDLAKQFGVKENDMIYLVGNKKHRIVVV